VTAEPKTVTAEPKIAIAESKIVIAGSTTAIAEPEIVIAEPATAIAEPDSKSVPMAARLIQINVNPQGGVPKLRVASARLEFGVFEGDRRNHRRFHGGPMRAICLVSLELIEALQSEGHPIVPGSTDEKARRRSNGPSSKALRLTLPGDEHFAVD